MVFRMVFAFKSGCERGGARCAYIGWGEEEASLMDVDDDGFVTLQEPLDGSEKLRKPWKIGRNPSNPFKFH